MIFADAANGLGDVSQLLQASGTVGVMLVLLYGVKGYIKELRQDDAVRSEKQAEQIREIVRSSDDRISLVMKAGDDRLVEVTQIFDGRLSNMSKDFREEVTLTRREFQDQVQKLADGNNAAITLIADEVRDLANRMPEDRSAKS